MQTRTVITGHGEDAYAWRDKMRKRLDASGRQDKIKTPVKELLPYERVDNYPENEIKRIHARLRTAQILDRIENPDVHCRPDSVAIEIKPRCHLSRCVQWEDEEAELRELINPDGFKAKQYLEFE